MVEDGVVFGLSVGFGVGAGVFTGIDFVSGVGEVCGFVVSVGDGDGLTLVFAAFFGVLVVAGCVFVLEFGVVGTIINVAPLLS